MVVCVWQSIKQVTFLLCYSFKGIDKVVWAMKASPVIDLHFYFAHGKSLIVCVCMCMWCV